MLDQFFDRLMLCDDATSRHLDTGARYIRHQPERAPLAFLHSLYPPVSEELLFDVEHRIGTLPKDYRSFLMRANGAALFEGIFYLYGCTGDQVERSPALEKRNAISLAFKNELFAATQPGLWSDGWISMGSVVGWSSVLDLEIQRDGRCAISQTGGTRKRRETNSFFDMLDLIMVTLEGCFSCSAVIDPTYAQLETSLDSLLQSH